MKIFTLEYSGTSLQSWANLGDDIQTIAAKRLLPRVDGSLYRENLAETHESGVISMNGFFMEEGSWPPAENLVPFFYSFHISPKAQKRICSRDGIAYLKKYAPIGCRDRGTQQLLLNSGVEAYYSKCISLTFAARVSAPAEGKVFLVDLSKAAASVVPKRIRKQAVVVNQAKVRIPGLSPATRDLLAEHLLDIYAKHATLVITSKIHCAMPCMAMGIPVVFLYDKSKKGDYRVEIIEDLIGINFVADSWLARKILNRFLARQINWSPEPVNLDEERKKIRDGYLKEFNRAAERYQLFPGL